jgi:hypothetical protein
LRIEAEAGARVAISDGEMTASMAEQSMAWPRSMIGDQLDHFGGSAAWIT